MLLGGVDLRVPPSQGKEFYKTLHCRGVKTRYGYILWFPFCKTFAQLIQVIDDLPGVTCAKKI
jgi:hypothetical protein